MAHRLLRDEKEEGWETSEFPIVCEVSCAGYARLPRLLAGDSARHALAARSASRAGPFRARRRVWVRTLT